LIYITNPSGFCFFGQIVKYPIKFRRVLHLKKITLNTGIICCGSFSKIQILSLLPDLTTTAIVPVSFSEVQPEAP